MPITDLLEQNCKLYGDDVALVELNPEIKDNRRMTWKEYDLTQPAPVGPYRREITWNIFNEKANRFAHLLLERGVKKGDKVAILLMNCLEWLPIYFGILKTGALAVPLNFRYTAQEIKYCVNLAEVDVLVFGPEFIGRVEEVADEIVQNRLLFYVGDNCPSFAEDYTKLTDLTLYFAKDVKVVKLECLSPIFDKLTGLMLPSAEVGIEEGVLSGIATLKRAAVPYNYLTSLNMATVEELTVLSNRNYTVPQVLFARATALRSLTLDAHVTALPTGAFAHCTALTTVTLDGTGEGLSLTDTVGRWVAIAFGGEGANPLCHGAALYFNSTVGHTSAERLTLPEKLTAIGAFVFDGCSNLRELTLGGRIVSVAQNAFRGTVALDTVIFGGTLSSWCSIVFEGEHANPISGAHALTIGGETVTDLVGLAAPTVSDYAFYGYLGLTAATLPQGVQYVGAYAFAHCAALASLTVPTSVSRIDARAFFNCTALYSATFDDPSGWYRYEGGSTAGGTAVSSYMLETPARAADALIATYVNYVFKKVR